MPVLHSRTVAIIGTIYSFDSMHDGLLVPFITTGIGAAFIKEDTDAAPLTTPLGTLDMPADSASSTLLAGHIGAGIEIHPHPKLTISIGVTFLGIPTQFDDPHQLPGVKVLTENAGGVVPFIDLLYRI